MKSLLASMARFPRGSLARDFLERSPLKVCLAVNEGELL
jgi:hypothetical protein